jgi:hypothetical protein
MKCPKCRINTVATKGLCKICYSRKYNIEHKEQVKQNQKDYYLRHKEKILARMKKYGQRPEVKEHHLISSRKYYHSPEGRKHVDEYNNRPENKERKRNYTRNYFRRYIGPEMRMFIQRNGHIPIKTFNKIMTQDTPSYIPIHAFNLRFV